MPLQNYQHMNIFLLISIINMKLRNDFANLDDLAQNYGIDANQLCLRMATENYYYQADINQFRRA